MFVPSLFMCMDSHQRLALIHPDIFIGHFDLLLANPTL